MKRFDLITSLIICVFVCIALFITNLIFINTQLNTKANKNKYLHEQYQAWTNYNKRTDVTFFEFGQLKDIGVLR